MSVLQLVALHEQALLDQIKEAKRRAGTIVADARAEAQRVADAAERRLEAEVVTLRREAEAAWEAERAALHESTEKKVADTRAKAAVQAPELVREVIALVLPPSPEKASS